MVTVEVQYIGLGLLDILELSDIVIFLLTHDSFVFWGLINGILGSLEGTHGTSVAARWC
jgi:hypothetical protein